jgi:hypothetical protein
MRDDRAGQLRLDAGLERRPWPWLSFDRRTGAGVPGQATARMDHGRGANRTLRQVPQVRPSPHPCRHVGDRPRSTGATCRHWKTAKPGNLASGAAQGQPDPSISASSCDPVNGRQAAAQEATGVMNSSPHRRYRQINMKSGALSPIAEASCDRHTAVGASRTVALGNTPTPKRN